MRRPITMKPAALVQPPVEKARRGSGAQDERRALLEALDQAVRSCRLREECRRIVEGHTIRRWSADEGDVGRPRGPIVRFVGIDMLEVGRFG